jgi:polyhydroxyalkanoate synthesis repressor PhaR
LLQRNVVVQDQQSSVLPARTGKKPDAGFILSCYYSATQNAEKQKSEQMAMLDKSKQSAEQVGPVVIKKYANRRLYNTESSTYVTLDDLAVMVRADRDFVVYDAKSGDDLTHTVLTQIIVEQESRKGSPTLLPIPFLRQLIRFYDDSMGNVVPGYLQFSLEALTQQQDSYRKKFANAWGTSGLEAYQEQARNNLKIFEQAMSIWTPFKVSENEEEAAAEGAKAAAEDPSSTPDGAEGGEKGAEAGPVGEIDALKAELEAMQLRIEKLSRSR